MTHDGRILALVREDIAREKEKNEQALNRRRAEAYAKAPELRQLEQHMTRLMTGVITGALEAGENAGQAVDSARSRCRELEEKRAALLSAAGLPGDYIDEKFTCPECRDTGYVLGKPCSCLKERSRAMTARELSSMLDLKGQSFETFDLDHYPAGSADSPRDIMSALLTYCRRYADSFGEKSGNLLFTGAPGLGKTFLSASIARVVSQNGFSVVYDTAVSVFDAFETQKFDRGGPHSEDAQARIRRYLECDLLILDDLGTEMGTAFTGSVLYTIVNTRLTGPGKTIISSNLSPQELFARYSPAVASRLAGEYISFCFVGTDYRLKND